MNHNLPYFLALNRITGAGPKTVLKLYEHWPDLSMMFSSSPAALQAHGLSYELATSITGFDLNRINEDLKWLKAANNHHLITWEHPQYPALLKEIANPPPVLYARGNLAALSQPKIAIVGTRNPSLSGSSNAFNFAKALSTYGLTIVSGLALGIDGQAHLGCLKAQGQTIAVLGTGMSQIYPAKHQKLAAQIMENGLLITEFPLNHPPKAGHFPQRNRIISGLSTCVLVIEAAVKSGSLITAHLALEQNRDVLALPGSIHNPLAKGCHQLIQQGAKLVSTVTDILDELNLERDGVLRKESNACAADLSQTVGNNSAQHDSALGDANKCLKTSNTQNILHFINFEVTSVDLLVEHSGLAIERIISQLAQLELQGIIAATPGGYVRIIG